MKYASAEVVFKEIAERVPAFKGLSYSKIETHGTSIKTEFLKASKEKHT
jgi:predicted molibdopterin-dependent oxidoreductase YjgC